MADSASLQSSLLFRWPWFSGEQRLYSPRFDTLTGYRNDYHNYLLQPLMYFGGVINLLIVLTTLHLRSRLRRIAQGGQDARNDAMIAEALQRAAEISAHPEPGQVVPTLRMQEVSGPINDYQNALDDEEKDMDDEVCLLKVRDRADLA